MRSTWFSAFLAALVLTISPGHAHEGHDHGPETPAAPVAAPPRGEARSDAFELVAVAKDGALTIYLDRLKTNEPVAGATVEVETPDGSVTAEDRKDGVYALPAPWLAKGGHIDLIFTVTVADEAEVLSLHLDVPAADAPAATPAAGARRWFDPAFLVPSAIGFICGVLIMALGRRRPAAATPALLAIALLAGLSAAAAHEGHDHGPPAPAAQGGGDRAVREASGAIFVPKQVQRVFGLRTIETARETLRRAVELPGRIIPDPTRSGFVQTAVGGRLSAPPGGFPRLGATVKAGDVLAYVTPPIQAVDVSDMRQRQGEIEQQISIVERRLLRYEQLAPSGAVPRFQLEEARLELEGLKQRRAALENIRREPEALVAPVSGIVAEGVPVAGQIAQNNSIVFQIVDPAKLWVEALSFDSLGEVRSATASVPTGKSLTLKFLGSGFTDKNQSVPVQFAIESDVSALRAGQLVTVFAETPEEREGIAVPRNAVVRAANGQHFVFEHVTAERFEPRAVRIEPLDAERVLILAGIDPGKRVVTLGAELLDQVR